MVSYHVTLNTALTPDITRWILLEGGREGNKRNGGKLGTMRHSTDPNWGKSFLLLLQIRKKWALDDTQLWVTFHTSGSERMEQPSCLRPCTTCWIKAKTPITNWFSGPSDTILCKHTAPADIYFIRNISFHNDLASQHQVKDSNFECHKHSSLLTGVYGHGDLYWKVCVKRLTHGKEQHTDQSKLLVKMDVD